MSHHLTNDYVLGTIGNLFGTVRRPLLFCILWLAYEKMKEDAYRVVNELELTELSVDCLSPMISARATSAMQPQIQRNPLF